MQFWYVAVTGASQATQLVKSPAAKQESWVRSLGQEDPLEKEMAPIPVCLRGESHEQRAWEAMVHRAAESQTSLKRLSMHAIVVNILVQRNSFITWVSSSSNTEELTKALKF